MLLPHPPPLNASADCTPLSIPGMANGLWMSALRLSQSRSDLYRLRAFRLRMHFQSPRSKSFKSSQSRSLNQTKWVPLAPCQIMSHMYQIFQYRLKLYLKIFSVPNVSAHSHNPIFVDRAHFPCALLSSHWVHIVSHTFHIYLGSRSQADDLYQSVLCFILTCKDSLWNRQPFLCGSRTW